jgi:hypothetical protein
MPAEILNLIIGVAFVPGILIATWWFYRIFKSILGEFTATEWKNAYWIWKFKAECKKRNIPLEELQKERDEWVWSLFKKKELPKHVLDRIDNDITGELEERKAKAETKK